MTTDRHIHIHVGKKTKDGQYESIVMEIEQLSKQFDQIASTNKRSPKLRPLKTQMERLGQKMLRAQEAEKIKLSGGSKINYSRGTSSVIAQRRALGLEWGRE